MNYKLFSACLASCICTMSKAQSSSLEINTSADLVSSYVWRGSYNAGASIQPSLSTSFSAVTFGVWGSTDIGSKGHKEVDLSVSYVANGFFFGVTDYWWNGEGANDYLHYTAHTGSHRWEGNFSYSFPLKHFPLSFSWNTMFAGNDYKKNGVRAYSSYIELNYLFSKNNVNINTFVGVIPWESPSILADHTGFCVCNVGIKAAGEIKITEDFSLPVFFQLILNPSTGEIFPDFWRIFALE